MIKKMEQDKNPLHLIQNLSIENLSVTPLEDRIELGIFNNLCGCSSCCSCKNSMENGRD